MSTPVLATISDMYMITDKGKAFLPIVSQDINILPEKIKSKDLVTREITIILSHLRDNINISINDLLELIDYGNYTSISNSEAAKGILKRWPSLLAALRDYDMIRQIDA